MKTHLPVLFVFFVFMNCFLLRGQNSQPEPFREIVTPDSVALNDSVPAVFSSEINFKRTLVARLKHQTDILEGLKEVVKKEKIKNAVILTGIGSVTRYHVHAVSNSSFPTENKFYKKDEPNDITSITGYITDGRVHAHISLSDGENSVGGHLEPGTTVFTFCIITIGIIDNSESPLYRFDDKTWR